VGEATVDFLAGLLADERLRRGTRADTRALSCRDQAVLVLRWFLDGTRMTQFARDNAISKPPATTTCTKASSSWLPDHLACMERCWRRRPPCAAM
jgi:hypothetical protein